METIEEFAERLCPNKQVEYDMIIEGAKWQQQRSYSEDDLEEAFKSGFTNCYNHNNTTFGEWFEQFEKTKYEV